jgi:hypothetical protein
MNNNLKKGLLAIVPVAALAINFLADYLADKEKDAKYVTKDELKTLLKDKKES